MRRPLHCPHCRQDGVLQSRRQSPREHVAALLFMVPFVCQHCRHRFLACRFGWDPPRHPRDRREHLRVPVRLFLSFSGGKIRGEGTVMDLSMGGCVIKSETQVHLDDIFYLEIAITQQDVIEVAAMVRSISGRGIAFKFLRKAQDNRRLLAFIQSHSRSAASSRHANTLEPTGSSH
jgi:hypothetical protein